MNYAGPSMGGCVPPGLVGANGPVTSERPRGAAPAPKYFLWGAECARIAREYGVKTKSEYAMPV